MHYTASTWHRLIGRSSGPRYQRPYIEFRTPVRLITYLKRNKIKRSSIFWDILLCPSRKLCYHLLGLLGVHLHFYTVDYLSKIRGFREHLVLKQSLVSAASVRLFTRLTRLANTNIATIINIIIILWIALYEGADWIHSAQGRDGPRAFEYTAITLWIPEKTSNSLTCLTTVSFSTRTLLRGIVCTVKTQEISVVPLKHTRINNFQPYIFQ
jgi:hypothetical protein